MFLLIEHEEFNGLFHLQNQITYKIEMLMYFTEFKKNLRAKEMRKMEILKEEIFINKKK